MQEIDNLTPVEVGLSGGKGCGSLTKGIGGMKKLENRRLKAMWRGNSTIDICSQWGSRLLILQLVYKG